MLRRASELALFISNDIVIEISNGIIVFNTVSMVIMSFWFQFSSFGTFNKSPCLHRLSLRKLHSTKICANVAGR